MGNLHIYRPVLKRSSAFPWNRWSLSFGYQLFRGGDFTNFQARFYDNGIISSGRRNGASWYTRDSNGAVSTGGAIMIPSLCKTRKFQFELNILSRGFSPLAHPIWLGYRPLPTWACSGSTSSLMFSFGFHQLPWNRPSVPTEIVPYRNNPQFIPNWPASVSSPPNNVLGEFQRAPADGEIAEVNIRTPDDIESPKPTARRH